MADKFILDDDNLWNDDRLTDRQTDRPQTLSEKIEESKRAIRLASDMSREFYDAPLIISYSGGKDSDVMLHLAELVLKPNEFEVLNSHTTVDAPETVNHIKEVFKRLESRGVKTNIDYHIDENGRPITMWNLIPRKLMPPTRIVRYCCDVLKESATPNRMACLGVRQAESPKRANRDIFGTGASKDSNFFSLDHAEEVFKESKEINDDAWDCTLIKRMKEKGNTIVSPIYYWSDIDIWDYIRQENIKMNPLYERGYKRVGCIGCPIATYTNKQREFAQYPKYKQLYINAFDRMIKHRKERGLDSEWETGEEVFNWWTEEYQHNVKGQITIDEWLKGEE